MFLEDYLEINSCPHHLPSTLSITKSPFPLDTSIPPTSLPRLLPALRENTACHTTLAMTSQSTPVDVDHLPRLLRLPLELRQEIYSHLCPAEPISNPIPAVGITCVSHRPPPLPFLLSCRLVHADVSLYYHAIATWKLIASHAFNFYRIDPTLSNLASSRLLKRLQRVELVFYFDGGLLKNYPSFKQQKYCDEIRKRATRACEILATAPDLRVVQVSWVDTITDTELEEKISVLDSLDRLQGKANLEIGCLQWSNAQASPQKEQFEHKLSSFVRAHGPTTATV